MTADDELIDRPAATEGLRSEAVGRFNSVRAKRRSKLTVVLTGAVLVATVIVDLIFMRYVLGQPWGAAFFSAVSGICILAAKGCGIYLAKRSAGPEH